ncbi:MAG TPA: site-2 protease family protein [Anaeromyxobacteraceae bacterium]|jgi:Zn-dependent protease|nr:site-2 protease family protein [Anaeromyxobacteraceae bacterium]
MLLVPLILSLTVHEYAHAWTAARLGDDTAERMGRLTLNPFAHIDLFGTILLPLLGIPFGWAKPVPIDPSRFRRGVKVTTGTMLTAGAGPLSNVLLAFVCLLILVLGARSIPDVFAIGSPGSYLLGKMFELNIVLAVFNLIPIPPLDGSRVLEGLLPYRFRPAWERFAALSPFLLIGLIFFGGRIIAGPYNLLATAIFRLVRVIA